MPQTARFAGGGHEIQTGGVGMATENDLIAVMGVIMLTCGNDKLANWIGGILVIMACALEVLK